MIKNQNELDKSSAGNVVYRRYMNCRHRLDELLSADF